MSKVQRVSAFRSAIEKVEEAKNTILEINISQIENPPFHDRTTISEIDIENLATNIKQVGLINPIIVRKKGNNYERIAGFRRIEASKKLGLEKIKAIVVEVDEKVSLLIMLSENLQREDLNPYDEVVSLLQLISINLDLEEEQVKSFLYRIKNHLSGNIKELSNEEKETQEIINSILSKTGKYNFQGFINRMRILNLNPIIIEHIRNKKVSYSHAVELNKLKDEEKIQELINEITENNLSKEALIIKIKALKEITMEKKENPFKELSSKIKVFYKLPKDKQTLVQQKLKELEALLS